MVIPIESIDKLMAFSVDFICGIWLYCAYVKKGRSNENLKSLFIFFVLMSAYELFAAAGMLLLTLDVAEVSVPLYNASYVIAYLLLFFAYAELISVALRLYFETAELVINVRKYYQAIIVIFGLVIIIVSAFYQAKPSFDQETFLISANHDPFVYKMMVAMILISMFPSSLLLAGRSFFAKQNTRAYVIMGAGVGLSLVGQLLNNNLRSMVYVMIADAAAIIGLIMLFYGANLTDVLCKHQVNLIKK
ncbi:MAG: hypothetical protein WC788_04185 [Candidatus Paceibacterota bacterium]|jgi:hypothetical protein